ncbi:serine/threonine protein phosphatase [Streptomyces spiroverticillatus]|uniref:Serine/threonine protein phosphatase n=1 Tax=Streptomyces finlayi TaxID=67296 RepID=A0A918X9H4_9ACTN|nr:mucin-2 [Streptomyces finlayi]GHA50727.1 serine/threonine protein phosphatase [Streptomyces spiroverticillatus]GHD19941.1 serine/threonine protein phosphatase [Streptomyces finlayi]
MSAARNELYARRQDQGSRRFQCDATAVRTRGGVRSYALLDGIGDTALVREWTRENTRFLAEGGIEHGEAYGALRALSAVCAVEARRPGAAEVGAVAVLAVVVPGKPVTIAWCGDARAYHQPAGGREPVLLTQDHNLRQQALDAGRRDVPDDWRHVVYSHLADTGDDPAIGQAALPTGSGGRLLLASDGAYECFHDYGQEAVLADVLQEITPARAVRRMLDFTAQWARSYADNATALIADLPGP